ncbi:probable BRI1 kinase inhibitor 1 [Phragmites australis]|uniref:probable BRI1 kinase inhibitor 1 n=1 Tax=Phragmites australis TaxID=29695 RepID=UPI002D792E00|nr:probable BRI1 kinase inhibitor 1 [Phragmites australis]
MSRRIDRVLSDLSHSNYHTAKDHGLHHQSTSNNDSGNAGNAKHNLLLLFSSIGSWRRSKGNGTGGAGAQNTKQPTKGTGKRRGLEIGQVVRKYVSMVEQLFTSYSGSSCERERRELRQRPHSFTSGRRGVNAQPKRHRGSLSSAPASLRGSPANSGHLSVGDSVKVSTSSEVSTMEELQSAIQAAIAHCKNSVTVAKQTGGDRCKC